MQAKDRKAGSVTAPTADFATRSGWKRVEKCALCFSAASHSLLLADAQKEEEKEEEKEGGCDSTKMPSEWKSEEYKYCAVSDLHSALLCVWAEKTCEKCSISISVFTTDSHSHETYGWCEVRAS